MELSELILKKTRLQELLVKATTDLVQTFEVYS
jgi:hypothetical protein